MKREEKKVRGMAWKTVDGLLHFVLVGPF